MSKCRMRTKNHYRENEIWFKQKTTPSRTMNGLGKPFRKYSDPRNRKHSKRNHSEIAAFEQKPLAFSINFIIGVKKFYAAELLVFSLYILE